MKLHLSIRARILMMLAFAAIVASGVAWLVGYEIARESLREIAFERVTAAREMKAAQIEDYFRQIVDQTHTLAESPSVLAAAKALHAGFDTVEEDLSWEAERRAAAEQKLRSYYDGEFLPNLQKGSGHKAALPDYLPGGSRTRALQGLYLAENRFEVGSKQLLDAAQDGSRYSAAHGQHHPMFRDLLERFGYYDLFLVEPEHGHIVYSVFKEVDFGTSLDAGPYRESNLARAFRAAREAKTRGFVAIEDFEAYAPSYEAYAAFIAAPVMDGSDLVAVLVLQAPVERINDIMTSKHAWSSVGLGTSGETYIVGDDFKLRNESRFMFEDKAGYLAQLGKVGVSSTVVQRIETLGSSIGLQEVRTVAAELALAGQTGTQVVNDYRNVRVLSAYRPLAIPGLRWVLLSEIDEAEAMKPVEGVRTRAIVIELVMIVLSLLLAVAFSRQLTRPLARLSQAAARLASGELGQKFEVASDDEIGSLAESLERMRRAIKRMVDRQAASIDALQTPFIPVHDDIVVMPLVGNMDQERMKHVRETLTQGLHGSHAKVAIVDVTGVPEFDEEVAEGLMRLARSAQLLGAGLIVTGMRASNAALISELDLPLEGLRTEGSLQRGIEVAREMLDETQT
jgi:methyl-accepting chemotaxis protein